MGPIIQLKNVSKTFKVPVKPKDQGFFTSLKSIFYRKWEDVQVLKNINLEIDQGEFVGYIGPNGAGKSTTLKILSGILTPSSGEVSVAGYVPYKQRYDYTFHIGVVFGQRSMLDFYIPTIESFKLYRDIYEVDKKDFEERLEFFSKILKIDRLMHIPVRKLSLGERMRCEIAASLLHKPKVVFLDEPTIGLDALAKEEIRNFLAKINKQEKTTIILTTHDMDDIEALCKRIILIDKGKIIHDGSLKEFKKNYINHKTMDFDILQIKDKRKFSALMKRLELVKHVGSFYSVRIPLNKMGVPEVVEKLLDSVTVIDLSLHEPRLEQIIKKVYGSF